MEEKLKYSTAQEAAVSLETLAETIETNYKSAVTTINQMIDQGVYATDISSKEMQNYVEGLRVSFNSYVHDVRTYASFLKTNVAEANMQTDEEIAAIHEGLSDVIAEAIK